MCGEHYPDAELDQIKQGSSPHVRGAPDMATPPRRRRGIIPACAGSTLMRPILMTWSGDHPRMCGEHRTSSWSMKRLTGSSPHVRGALGAPVHGHVADGIIPACAGSTAPHIPRRSCPWDHPRMCGEHDNCSSDPMSKLGSSPHVRGAHGCATPPRPRRGIIPACAGSTRLNRLNSSRSRDHPRMCGEHSPAS